VSDGGRILWYVNDRGEVCVKNPDASEQGSEQLLRQLIDEVLECVDLGDAASIRECILETVAHYESKLKHYESKLKE